MLLPDVIFYDKVPYGVRNEMWDPLKGHSRHPLHGLGMRGAAEFGASAAFKAAHVLPPWSVSSF